ncbi:hypothetical protein [Mesorhizobium japonicum]|uniref:Msr8514 protein n=1 Tax=Mesorhizobium japonicum (strain LMG 29417 / CECT 9101 / MAFF 303099) TaxID=266835 RepID=Q982S8_RHILO|nr:hypothetical protein [Mesorhizobium japonicum]BAB54378.1 msr8514 [Mesorhizobium japonicum MAFF 303099]
MTARVENQIEGQLARKLAPVVREMLLAEVERIAASQPRPKPKSVSKADDDIMEACRQVASAADRLAQAKYGVGEISARKSLERAATVLGRAMRKHGRMP